MNILCKKMMVVAVVLPLTFSGAYATARHNGERNAMPIQAMLKQVDLSAEQQLKIDSLLQSHRLDIQAQKKPTDFHDGLMTIIKAEKFDSAKVEELIDSREALRKDKKLQRIKMQFDVYHTLNVEQQAKMELLFEQHHQKMMKKGKKQGQHHGKGQRQCPTMKTMK